MAPTPCPVCGRQMCDHTCFERGQTFAQMMGDPPGSIKHRKGEGCCCDKCTDPSSSKPRGAMTRFEKSQEDNRLLQEKAADILVAQEVTKIQASPWGDGRAGIFTDGGSLVEIWLDRSDVTFLLEDGIAFMQPDDDHLILFTSKKREIRCRVVALTIHVDMANKDDLAYMKARS